MDLRTSLLLGLGVGRRTACAGRRWDRAMHCGADSFVAKATGCPWDPLRSSGLRHGSHRDAVCCHRACSIHLGAPREMAFVQVWKGKKVAGGDGFQV